jgi:hypothetical protein
MSNVVTEDNGSKDKTSKLQCEPLFELDLSHKSLKDLPLDLPKNLGKLVLDHNFISKLGLMPDRLI